MSGSISGLVSVSETTAVKPHKGPRGMGYLPISWVKRLTLREALGPTASRFRESLCPKALSRCMWTLDPLSVAESRSDRIAQAR